MVSSCIGAVTIGFSAIFFELAHVDASTGALFRCLYALPALLLLARYEQGRQLRVARRPALLAALAGVAFAADLIAWHHAVQAAGAGLGTVLGQSQILFMTAFSVLVLREVLTRRTGVGIVVVLLGGVCVAGVLESAPYGDQPGLGVLYGLVAGATYVVFILLLREANAATGQLVMPLLIATVSATVCIALLGTALGELEWPSSWASQGWLLALALSAQVAGWLLISSSMVALPPIVTSMVLSLQPGCAVVFAMIILGESPSALQLTGAALIVVGFATATMRRGASAGRRTAPAR
ncbi:DMT family transporter [Conexibacter woesei]|uniref:EamA domain-containing protein n=1 Tax=Conexibacter woesei (strain DSM 14684 / CCUG 47730 / CIP 108061 / JCM 11494 / NBRC 100937 / ID131577) TaxID=469383 RepID=D3F9D5_CONWI|nr:DMT family transporter [Conexibacter woesei]ADB49102.1 protein of unknown function DUF6 transmembrane [Conexibacter woesei DSM 14684]